MYVLYPFKFNVLYILNILHFKFAFYSFKFILIINSIVNP